MDDNAFVANLRIWLSGHPPRKIISDKRCATAALLRPSAPSQVGSYELLFLKRATNEKDPWSGDIAFPGGKREPFDEDDRATAVRETYEETGIDLRDESRWEYVGQMRDILGHRTRPFVLCCFVFVCKDKSSIEVALNPSEMADYRWVPLSWLVSRPVRAAPLNQRWIFQSSVWYVIYATLGVDKVYIPEVVLDPSHSGYVLWGLTLRSVSMLLHRGGRQRLDIPPFIVRDSVVLHYIHEKPFALYQRWCKGLHHAKL